jgi:hypothetical protein
MPYLCIFFHCNLPSTSRDPAYLACHFTDEVETSMITTGAAIFPDQSLVAWGVQPDILARLRFSKERRHPYKFDHATVRNAVDVHIILCCRRNHVGQAHID